MNQAQRDAAAAVEPLLGQIEFLPEGLRVEAKRQALERARRLHASRLAQPLPADTPAVIAVVGGTNVGKSTVFNLILDDRVALPTPTAIGTKSAALSVPNAWRDRYDSPAFLPWFDKRSWTSPEPLNEEFDGQTPRLYLHLRRRGLGLAVIDTPDIDAVNRRNHRTTDDIFHVADGVVFVTTPTKYADEVCVDYLARAVRYGKRLIVIFNRSRGGDDAAYRHFCEVILPPLGIGDETPVIAVPYDENLMTHGGRWKISLRYYIKRLEEQSAEIRAAAQTGAAQAFGEAFGAVVDLLADEADAAAGYLAALRRAADDEAEKHAQFLAQLPFDELEEAFVEVLHEQRVPGLDWVYEQFGGVKRWLYRGGRQVWATVKGVFGGDDGVPQDLEQVRRGREQQQASERLTRLLARQRDLLRDVPAELREAVAVRLPELAAGRESEQAVERYLDRAETLRREMVREAKEQVLTTLREKQLRVTSIKLLKGAARGLTLGLVVVTGGLGAEDLIIAPAADMVLKTWLDKLFGRSERESLRRELSARRRALFAELLDEVAVQPVASRLPACCTREFVTAAREAARGLAASG